MTMWHAIREVQIPLLATMLIAGCATKLLRMGRAAAADGRVGPTALFPMHLRRPVAIALCVAEGGLGIGLIVTAGPFGQPTAANCIRIGCCLLFLIAISALIELRQTRPDVGCGCFGDFSTAPVSGRTLARSALFAIAALTTYNLGPISRPATTAEGLRLAAILVAEMLLIAALSPEVGEGLVRLGYSEPCELRDVPTWRTLTALRRSKYWRRYADLITSDVPVDVWRELCWRYIVYPARYADRPAEVVFAVFLQHRRPVVHVALVDSSTGVALESPTGKRGSRGPGRAAVRRLANHLSPAFTAAGVQAAPADMPFSTDL
ncbi:MAG TPA: MauE/DoxX family redox-associated membrane protein [Streptosporangiaceae bacterium]|nr:MauE/DoxX family redox-associated membrane protein [Streptosporangiaceae bacterium]